MFKFIQSTYLNTFRHYAWNSTKTTAIKLGLIDYLNIFELKYSIKSQSEKTEKYLIAVLQKKSKSENFDELRYEQCIDKSKSLTELASTSSSIEEHSSRC